MTRESRIHAVACALVRTLHNDRWSSARVISEAIANQVVRRIAEAALDAADSTRDPCECRQCRDERSAKVGGL